METGLGEGAGQRTPRALLPHVSFDVVQAEGHTLICAAPLGLLLAFPSSTQPVLNDLGEVGQVGWTGTPNPVWPCPALPPLPHRHSQRVPAL